MPSSSARCRRRMQPPALLIACGVAAAPCLRPQAIDAMPAHTLPASEFSSSAYDEARGRLVLTTYDPSGPTLWEWDGRTFHRSSGAAPPVQLIGYDRLRRRVVALASNETALAVSSNRCCRSFACAIDEPSRAQGFTTFEWDGETWWRIPVNARPEGEVTATYDVVRQRLLAVTARGETWEWDGQTWLLHRPATALPALIYGILAYDFPRRRAVLVDRAPYASSWEWDGNDWRRGPGPGASSAVALAYSPGLQRVVWMGSAHNDRFDRSAEWDGTRWIAHTPPPATPQVLGTAFSYGDPVDGKIHLLVSSPGFARVWSFDGRVWQLVSDSPAPGQAVYAGAAYDTARQRVVVFANTLRSPPYAPSTWEWDGFRWHHVVAGVQPATGQCALAYDSARRRTVYFGGQRPGQTWEWDGTVWSQRVSTAMPQGRTHHGMAYDAARFRTVVFGGNSDTGAALNDTWLWDGTVWTRANPATVPAPARTAALAYDAARQRVVMFRADVPSETWEWDGSDWALRARRNAPVVADTALVYDSKRGRVLLYGGLNYSDFSNDLWEWDGSTWTALATPTELPPRAGHAMAFDAARQRTVVAFGNHDSGIGSGDTWLIGDVRPAWASSFGTACGARAPRLIGPGLILVHDAVLELLDARANAPCWFGLGVTASATAIGPCTLWLRDPFLLAPAVSNAGGATRLRLRLPWLPALRGTSLIAQGFVLDPLSPFGVAMSAGRRLGFGD